MPLINCEVSLILTWSREWEITSIERRVIKDTWRYTFPINATFQIRDTNLYVSVVTLSNENEKKALRIIKNRI